MSLATIGLSVSGLVVVVEPEEEMRHVYLERLGGKGGSGHLAFSMGGGGRRGWGKKGVESFSLGEGGGVI